MSAGPDFPTDEEFDWLRDLETLSTAFGAPGPVEEAETALAELLDRLAEQHHRPQMLVILSALARLARTRRDDLLDAFLASGITWSPDDDGGPRAGYSSLGQPLYLRRLAVATGLSQRAINARHRAALQASHDAAVAAAEAIRYRVRDVGR